MNKGNCQMLIGLLLLAVVVGCSPTTTVAPTTPIPTLSPTVAHSPTTTPTLEPSSTPTPIRTPVPTHVFQEKDSPDIKAFKPSANCPNVCWMGIHPGTTSAGQAISIITNSKDVEQIQISGDHISAIWVPDRTREYPNDVGISVAFSNALVKSVSLEAAGLINIDVRDFMSLVGEPDEIKIYNSCIFYFAGDSCYSDYILFYSKMSAAVYINHGNGGGPASDDFITKITINLPVEDPNIFQPW